MSDENPEFRWQEDDSGATFLDEVVCKDVKSVHAEMMSDRQCWVGIDLRDGRQVVLVFTSKRKPLDFCARVE